MFNPRPTASHRFAVYATSADFCRIFQEQMTRLYLLSFLLTADHSLAEGCFVLGLRDSVKNTRVSKEFTESWARKVLIQNAIELLELHSSDAAISANRSKPSGEHTKREPAEVAAILELGRFDRLVFVMSVLEGYSDQDCSLLLKCTRGEATAARIRALEQIGKSASLGRGMKHSGSRRWALSIA